MWTITYAETLGIISFIFTLSGIAFGYWQWKKRKGEHKKAYHEIRHVFSQLLHIQWWIQNKVTPNGNPTQRKEGFKQDEMQNLIVSQLHQLAITLKSNALLYSKEELKQITPHPDEVIKKEKEP